MADEVLPEASAADAAPQPFTFTPQAGPFIEGPAFSLTFKTVTTLMVLGVGFWLALLWEGQHAKGGGTSLLVYFFAALLMLVYFAFWILRSRTRIDATGLHQTWVSDKYVPFADLAVVGVIRIRGFEWLIAPRAHARTRGGKFTVFQAASPALLDEFDRLSRELQAWRQR